MKTVSNNILSNIYSNIAIVLLLVYFYILCVDLRFITGDEGYFAYASKAILEGKTPYKDFFYPQAFLYPYFLAIWSHVLGESWQVLRLFSAVVATLIGYLIFDIIKKKRNVVCAIVGLLLYVTSDLVIGYFTVIKNYSLAIFFLLLALRIYESKYKYKYFIIGLLLSIVFQIRSYLIVCELPFIYLILKYNPNNTYKKNLLLLFLGNLIGILPTLYIVFKYFDEFVFNNLTYHSLRNREGLVTGVHQKFNSLCSIFTGVKNTGDISIQLLLLIILMCIKKVDFKSIYFYLSIVVFVVSFLPTPVFMQYFVAVVPFIILYFFTTNETYLNKQLFKFLCCLIFAIYFINFFVEFNRYNFNGNQVSGIYSRKVLALWRPKNLDTQIENIEKRLYLEEGNDKIKVFTSWPGYLIGMNVSSLNGLENHFARNIAHKLSKEDVLKYKIIYSDKDLTRIVDNKEAKFLILGYRDKKHDWQRLARKRGYRLTNYKIIKFLY